MTEQTQTTPETPSTDMERWVQAHAQLSPAARERWEVTEVRTIRNAVAPNLNPHEFQMMMAMAAKYDLDPLAHEIWGAKSKARDGSEGKVLIMVGRDGLLKVARRDASYAGFDSDVVRQNDVFKVRRSKDGREIIHEYEGDTAARGEIVGAWAQVYQKGHHDTYFFAPWSEYFPNRQNDKSPWGKQPSVMIQKCALSLCLRLAFNLSGVVAEEEAAAMMASQFEDSPEVSEVSYSEVEAAVPPELRDRFTAAYVVACDVRPGVLSPASMMMSVRDQSPERVAAYIARMELENGLAERDAEEIADAVVEPDVPIDDGGLPAEGAEMIRARLDQLRAREPGTDREAEERDDEIEHLEEQLRQLGEPTGQEAML